MKDDAKQALTPKLRFPEFLEAEGWHEKALKDICSINPPSDDLPDSFVYIDLESVEGGILNSRNRINKKDAPSRAQRLLRNGDVVFQIVRPYQRNNLFVQFEGYDQYVASTGYAQLRANDSDAFLYQVVHTDPFVDKVIAKCTGSSYPAINSSDLADVCLFVPANPREQQKIADCLTSLDEVIAAQGRKVEALKAHKKGLMQQLFPREGETVPRLRFPEFRNTGEWEEKKLEVIGRVIRGSSPRPQGDSRYYSGPVPRLMVQDVTRDGKWVTPRIDSLTEEGAKLSRPCPAGTLTIVCSGTVGVVSFLAVDACIHDGFLALIDIDESIATKDFLFHSLSTLREQFEKGATHGGVFTNLTTSGIKEFKIYCPNIPEQAKVADCLSFIDAQIAAESEKLDALKTHKKGLMQQLFPSPEGD